MLSSATLFPIVTVEEVERDVVNDLFVRWQHPLGMCERPFGHNSHVLIANGEIVAATHTASIVSPTVQVEWDNEGDPISAVRKQTVELARIGRADGAPWAMRVMLRLWRETIARQEWPHWPVKYAISYSIPGYNGNVYRFDGWTKVKDCKRSSPGKGSTWAKGSATDAIGDGKKGLYVYRYPAEEIAA